MEGDTSATVERIDVFGYELAYAHGDYVMSSGRIVNRLSSTVARISTRGGTTGFGEICPLGSTYLPAFGEGARTALRELAPALLGADVTNLAVVPRRMDRVLLGHRYAHSAPDVTRSDSHRRPPGPPVGALPAGVLHPPPPLPRPLPPRPRPHHTFPLLLVRQHLSQRVSSLCLLLAIAPSHK